MTAAVVTRHTVELGVPDGYDERVVAGVEEELADLESQPHYLGSIASDLVRLMGWRCFLDPTVNKLESWEATVMAMQAASGIFEVANATEGNVDLSIGERKFSLAAGGTKGIAHAGNWVRAYYLAVICREQDRLTTLAEGTDPDAARIAPPDLMLKVLFPPIGLFYRFIQNQRPEFNDALAQALDLHKAYWDTLEGGRNRKPAEAVALGPLAMTCLAYDGEFPIEVESDYLPTHLIKRSWLGEFPTK